MCDHQDRPCPGARCGCPCMNCQFPADSSEQREAREFQACMENAQDRPGWPGGGYWPEELMLDGH